MNSTGTLGTISSRINLAMLTCWPRPQVCRREITSGLLQNDWFVSTNLNASLMKCFVNRFLSMECFVTSQLECAFIRTIPHPAYSQYRASKWEPLHVLHELKYQAPGQSWNCDLNGGSVTVSFWIVAPTAGITLQQLKYKSLCSWGAHHVPSVLYAFKKGCFCWPFPVALYWTNEFVHRTLQLQDCRRVCRQECRDRSEKRPKRES